MVRTALNPTGTLFAEPTRRRRKLPRRRGALTLERPVPTGWIKTARGAELDPKGACKAWEVRGSTAKRTRHPRAEVGLLDGVLSHLAAAAERLALRPEQTRTLAEPERVLRFEIPVTMDDQSQRTFSAWRILHSTALGPGKGGIRVAQGVNEQKVGGLSAEMPIKPAIHQLPLGGAKGGIDADASSMSPRELASLLRGYVDIGMDTAWAEGQSIAFGPKTDVPAPDVGTSPPDINLMDVCADQLLAWLVRNDVKELDGYEVPAELAEVTEHGPTETPLLKRYIELFDSGRIDNLGLISTFTGKSVGKGGSEGRGEATGLGVAFATLALLSRQGLLPEGAERFTGQTVAVQGYGNVGLGAVASYVRLGARVQSIAEFDGEPYAIVKLGGFTEEDVPEMAAYKREHGTLRGFPGTREISINAFWRQPVDVLAPCARENEINSKIAALIKAKVVVEGANGPTSPGADRVLAERGIFVAPDVFANSAGVAVSYFEMVQNQRGERWELEEVRNALREMVIKAFSALSEVQEASGGTLREAAYDVGVLQLSGGAAA